MIKVLYHANCNDGSGAALAAWLKLGDQPNVEYIPVQHGGEPPDVADCFVYMLDFTYPRQTMIELLRECNSMLVIDHHAGAQVSLEGLKEEAIEHGIIRPGDFNYIFDNNHSGAVLAWQYFHRDSEIPTLLKTIEDRDLWRFEYPETRCVHLALTLHRDWRKWLGLDYHGLVCDGYAIAGYIDRQIENQVERPQRIALFPSEVPVYNAPGYICSDLLHRALEVWPDASFAVSYFDLEDGSRVFSLRSRPNEDVDVSAIARKYGGNGHTHAAGFRMK